MQVALQDVLLRRGLMALTPRSVKVLGGKVRQQYWAQKHRDLLCVLAFWQLIAGIGCMLSCSCALCRWTGWRRHVRGQLHGGGSLLVRPRSHLEP